MFVNSALHVQLWRALPYLVAGLIAGRLAGASDRRSKILAVVLLAAVSATAWTLFTFATRDMSFSKALGLYAITAPIHLLLGLWAYFGMFLSGRFDRTRPAGTEGGAEPDQDRRVEIGPEQVTPR